MEIAMKNQNKETETFETYVHKVNEYNLFRIVKYFNKWIFIPLPCEAKPWILWALDLTAEKKNIHCLLWREAQFVMWPKVSNIYLEETKS
jgi:hypothetical protein